MKLLCIDTASNVCGVSILEDKNLICKLDTDTGRTHSENLMPMIENAFSKASLSLKDIDLIVCDKGPGSFTGIRIGVATAKAFHDSMNIPRIGVSSLESLAYNVKNNGYICSILDCKNENCYFAIYKLNDGIYTEIIKPSADTVQNLLTILKNYEDTITFVGDGALIYQNEISLAITNACFVPKDKNILDSYTLGLVGLDRYLKKDLDDVLPLYLKKPQAQRQLEKKLK